jgi:hypothetical protein
LSNFSKELYHWLVVGYNEAQRCCVWLVEWLSLKVSKQITDRKFQRNFQSRREQAITYSHCCAFVIFLF